MNPWQNRLVSWGLFLTLAMIVGCSEDDTNPVVPDPEPEPEYILPSTPDSLILAFRNAYDLRASALIDSLFDPDFTFEFETAESDTFAIESQWDKATEVAAMRRLFEGAEGVWPNGEAHPPVNGFPFNCMITPLEGSEWVIDEAAGTYSRLFQISLLVTLVDFDAHFIGGTNRFVVQDIGLTGGPNGEVATGFAILRWEDIGFTNPEPRESTTQLQPSRHLSTWGFLKAIFRAREGILTGESR